VVKSFRYLILTWLSVWVCFDLYEFYYYCHLALSRGCQINGKWCSFDINQSIQWDWLIPINNLNWFWTILVLSFECKARGHSLSHTHIHTHTHNKIITHTHIHNGILTLTHTCINREGGICWHIHTLFLSLSSTPKRYQWQTHNNTT
jgi:hypothetical protein